MPTKITLWEDLNGCQHKTKREAKLSDDKRFFIDLVRTHTCTGFFNVEEFINDVFSGEDDGVKARRLVSLFAQASYVKKDDPTNERF